MKLYLSLALISSALVASAAPLYSQLPDLTPGADGGGFSDFNQQLADSFNLSSNASVDQVTVWGDFFFAGAPLADGATRNFSVRFFSDASNLPSSVLVNESAVGTALKVGTVTDFGTHDALYQFTINLPTAVSLTAGQSWISVLDADGTSSYRWMTSLTGASNGAVRSGDFGGWRLDSGARSNEAFELNSSAAPTPEPASMIALATMAGIVAKRRKKA